MARGVIVGLFERAHEKDRHGEWTWRAWRHRITGGIWYGSDTEDYTMVEASTCKTCDGTGRDYPCPIIVIAQACAFKPREGLCRVCGKSQKCVICDGTGYHYTPLTRREG